MDVTWPPHPLLRAITATLGSVLVSLCSLCTTDGAPTLQYTDSIADAYSCGVTLYVLLAGQFPFVHADEDSSCSSAVRLQRQLTRALAGDIVPVPQVPACLARVQTLPSSDCEDDNAMAQDHDCQYEPKHASPW